MKKSVAIGIAGIATLVVAAWRQIQRDNTLDTDTGADRADQPAPTADEGPFEAPAPEPSGDGPGPSGSTSALFTPSIDGNSTKAELYKMATELGIDGRSKMNKSELLDAIRAAS